MFYFHEHQHVWGLHWKEIDLSLVLWSTHLQALLNQALNHGFSYFQNHPLTINRCEGKLDIHGWLNFFPLNNLVISSFRSNCTSVYIGVFLLLLFPSFSNTKQTRCIWFTSGGSRRGRVLPAPPRNVLRGVEGGAAVGVIYFVNIFRPQGPHSRPPWPVSRPRLSARESITSSGYGPFKLFPQLWLSFSCSSGGRPRHPALPRNRHGHQAPRGRAPWCLTGPGPHRACPCPCPPASVHLRSPGVTHLSLLAHSGREASSSLPEQPKTRSAAGPSFSFLSPTPAFSAPSQNPWASTWGWDFSPEPRPLAWGVTCRELFLLSALPFFLSSLRRADIWLKHHERTRYSITWLCQIA